jgi:IS5 family transposase
LQTITRTCAPANIRYPQDFSLLNEAREKLETIIIRFCKTYGLARPKLHGIRLSGPKLGRSSETKKADKILARILSALILLIKILWNRAAHLQPEAV